jgi:hypothetical protein
LLHSPELVQRQSCYNRAISSLITGAGRKVLIRRQAYSAKTDKDRIQAAELIRALRAHEPERLRDALRHARK